MAGSRTLTTTRSGSRRASWCGSMRALDRKMLRDLRGMRGQVIAIALVIIAGVATFVSMHSVMQALQQTLAAYYRDYRFADGFASVRRAPETLADRIRAVPG